MKRSDAWEANSQRKELIVLSNCPLDFKQVDQHTIHVMRNTLMFTTKEHESYYFIRLYICKGMVNDIIRTFKYSLFKYFTNSLLFGCELPLHFCITRKEIRNFTPNEYSVQVHDIFFYQVFSNKARFG